MKKSIYILSALMFAVAIPEGAARVKHSQESAAPEAPVELAAAAKNFKAPAKKNEHYVTPDGTRKYYVNNNFYFYKQGSSVTYMQDDEIATELIFDGEMVYMKDPFGGFATRSFLEGSMDYDHNQIVFELPQLIYEDDGIAYYATAMYSDYTEGDDGRQKLTYTIPEDINEYRLSIQRDGSIISTLMGNEGAYPDAILGLVNSNGVWMGYGDANFKMTPYEPYAPMAIPPTDGETGKCILEFDNDGSEIDVVRKGDDIYFGNITQNTNAYIHAKVKDGKVVMEGTQFMGTSDGYWLYLGAVPVTKVYTETDWYYDFPTLNELGDDDPMPWLEEVVFDYDEEKNKIHNSEIGLIEDLTELQDFYPVIIMAYPTFRALPENPVYTAPRTPYVSMGKPYDSAWGYGQFYVDLPKLDLNGNLIDIDNAYYEVYFDGEIVTFGFPEYQFIYDAMTKVPYTFSDRFDIQWAGEIEHLLAYYREVNRIDVYLYYKAPDGNTYKSAPGVWTASQVDIMTTTKTPESVEYYDMQGRKISNPENGVVIKRSHFDDGSATSSKVVVRK